MRHYYGSAPFRRGRQCCLHLDLGFRVESGGGFIQQQQGRVAAHGASNRNALLLAAAQLHASLTHLEGGF